MSSSGHLVLANYWFGFGGADESLELAVDIATNTGTFLAVLVVLRRDVAAAVVAVLQGLRRGERGREARRAEGWRIAWLVVLASIPTAVLIFGLKAFAFERLNAPVPVSIALALTGLLLWLVPRGTRAPKRSAGDVTWRDAALTGLAQGLAGIPGISRSGSTIAVLLARGVRGDLAARLSFLMYLVASLGVALLGVGEVRDAGFGAGPLVAMTLASFATGYVALLWLFRLLRAGRFRWFAPYLWIVAAATLVRALAG